jgi:hypothetical protein
MSQHNQGMKRTFKVLFQPRNACAPGFRAHPSPRHRKKTGRKKMPSTIGLLQALLFLLVIFSIKSKFSKPVSGHTAVQRMLGMTA